jgi:putative PIN family toxin of toxin-antitoxin system
VRIILDTNVFVSGVFWSGPPHKILEAWASGKISLVLSLEILEEYQRIGRGLHIKFPTVDFAQILILLEASAEISNVSRKHISVCEDPDDDKCKVPLIVSGDKHLLQVSNYAGIKVMKPKEFFTQCTST